MSEPELPIMAPSAQPDRWWRYELKMLDARLFQLLAPLPEEVMPDM